MSGSFTGLRMAPAAFNHSAPLVQIASISLGMPATRYSSGMPTLRPLMLPVRAFSKSGTGMSTDVESFGSKPHMERSMMAASFTVRVIGPAWSRDEANATMPQREHRP